MRALLLTLVLAMSACQEDPGVIVIVDDAGQFQRYDAGDADLDASDTD